METDPPVSCIGAAPFTSFLGRASVLSMSRDFFQTQIQQTEKCTKTVTSSLTIFVYALVWNLTT